jgi:hypothetical protein
MIETRFLMNAFNPQISQITLITMNVGWRLRNLPNFLANDMIAFIAF